MHKYSWNWKKPKNPLVWAKNLKKPQKTQKTQKNPKKPTGLGLKKKNLVFSNPNLNWQIMNLDDCLDHKASVADPDPGLGAFLTPGSGIRDGRKSASGSGIRDEQPGSYFFRA